MEIVSRNSDKETARNRLLEELSFPLRDLVANLLRITRGAGKSYDLIRQISELGSILTRYRDVVGHYPTSAKFDNCLSGVFESPYMDKLEGNNLDEELAIQSIIRGAFQLAASRMLHQIPQASSGEYEMFSGIDRLEAIREERRKEWAGVLSPRSRRKRASKRKANL